MGHSLHALLLSLLLLATSLTINAADQVYPLPHTAPAPAPGPSHHHGGHHHGGHHHKHPHPHPPTIAPASPPTYSSPPPAKPPTSTPPPVKPPTSSPPPIKPPTYPSPPPKPLTPPPAKPPTYPSPPPTKPPTKPPTAPPTKPPTSPPVKSPTYPPTKPPTSPPVKPPTYPSPPPAKPPVKPPTYPPMARKMVAVQGVVYCKNCTYAGMNTLMGASPLANATVVLKCKNTKYLIKKTATTDKNGYFFLQAPPLITTYGAHKCRVFLVQKKHVPKGAPHCTQATPLNGGLTGAPLFLDKKAPPTTKPLPFVLYSVGPFAFEPPKCYKH